MPKVFTPSLGLTFLRKLIFIFPVTLTSLFVAHHIIADTAVISLWASTPSRGMDSAGLDGLRIPSLLFACDWFLLNITSISNCGDFWEVWMWWELAGPSLRPRLTIRKWLSPNSRSGRSCCHKRRSSSISGFFLSMAKILLTLFPLLKLLWLLAE